MKEKIIKKVLNEKKPITSIFLVVPSICLLVIPVFSILMMTDATLKENIEVIKEICMIFGILGIAGLSITLYLMKYTKKLNIIKVPKEELEILYDKYIDDKFISNLEKTSKQVALDYEKAKKNSFTNILINIIIIAITGYMFFGLELLNFFAYLIGIICVISVCFLFNQIEVALKSTERLVEEYKVKRITDVIWLEAGNINEKAIKELKNKEREDKDKKIARKNPILFWLIEIILFIWCITMFNSEILSMIKTDGIAGLIGILITFGIPAFFFIRNIYVRYFKENK